MKHIHWYILALAAVLLAGCSKESGGEIIVPDAPQQNGNTPSPPPIGFAADGDWAPLEKKTRAGEDDYGTDPSKNGFTDGDKFGVFAYYIPSGGSLTTANFMYNQLVTGTDSNSDSNVDTWDYSPVKYWPEPEDKISFYAYYPHSSVKPVISAPAQETSGEVKLDYTTTNFRTDVLYAMALNKSKPNDNSPVQFNFNHLLGQIQFKVSVTDNDNETSNAVLWLRKISYNVPGSATITFPNSDGTPLQWENGADKTCSYQPSGEGFEINESDGAKVYHQFTAFHIPCTINSLNIDISTDGYTHHSIPATPASPISIESGKITVVNLTISTKKITITATTQDWAVDTINPGFNPDNI